MASDKVGLGLTLNTFIPGPGALRPPGLLKVCQQNNSFPRGSWLYTSFATWTGEKSRSARATRGYGRQTVVKVFPLYNVGSNLSINLRLVSKILSIILIQYYNNCLVDIKLMNKYHVLNHYFKIFFGKTQLFAILFRYLLYLNTKKKKQFTLYFINESILCHYFKI